MDDSDVESICSSVSETGSPEASSGAKVYIGSQLPYFVTEKVIRNHFLQYGFGDCVTSVKLVYKDGRFMGWGCVYLKTAEYAQDAISKVNGTNLLVHEKYEHVLVVQHYVHKTRFTSLLTTHGDWNSRKRCLFILKTTGTTLPLSTAITS